MADASRPQDGSNGQAASSTPLSSCHYEALGITAKVGTARACMSPLSAAVVVNFALNDLFVPNAKLTAEPQDRASEEDIKKALLLWPCQLGGKDWGLRCSCGIVAVTEDVRTGICFPIE